MKRKEGAFVVAQAAIFVGVITLVALPAQSASQQQVSTSQTQSESGWHVVRSNLTVHGMPAFLGGCVATAAWCPTLSQSISLTPVNLITYKGTYYYAYTGEVTITEVGVSQNTTRYTAWFTNSTLYCVTGFDTAPITCPSQASCPVSQHGSSSIPTTRRGQRMRGESPTRVPAPLLLTGPKPR